MIAAAPRARKDGLHWTQEGRGRVGMAPAGVDALCASLGLPAPKEKERGRQGLIRSACWAGRHRTRLPQTPLPQLLMSRYPHASVGCSRTPAEWPSTTTGSPCRSGCVPTPGWQSKRPSASASIPTVPSHASPQPSLGSTLATPAELSVLVALADQANDDGICWPNIGSVSRRNRLSERTVQRALHTLVADRQTRPRPSTLACR